MLTLAVASLVLGTPAPKKQQAYLLPLYDLVTNVNNGTVTANFMVSNNWSSNYSFNNFGVFYENGDTSHFSPNGSWHLVASNNLEWTATGNTIGVSFSFGSGSTPLGTLWIQSSGGAADSPNGAEMSFVAAGYGMQQGAGHGSRPGAYVPIIDRTPESGLQNTHNVPIVFDIYSPFGGAWGNSTPQFWQNNGQNAVEAPGNGWQALPQTGLLLGNVPRMITTTGQASSNAGAYMVGVQETYTPSESYNTHNSQWTEFSGIIRPFSVN